MANLFYIHTPFQLFVAQQIINQENLKNNIMLYGYIKGNQGFLDIYDLITIPEMWVERIEFLNNSTWATEFAVNSFADSKRRLCSDMKKMEAILVKFDITSLYFGDIHNVNYQFLASIYKKKGYSINFYEEGSSHYYDSPFTTKLNKLKRLYLCIKYDLLFFLPFWRTTFAKWVFLKGMKYKDIPMDRRYSIIPFYNEKYDVRLTPAPLMSDRIRRMVSDDIERFESMSPVLYLSEPIDEKLDDNSIELKTLSRVFGKLASDPSKKTVIFLKFHPRETDEKKHQVCSILEEVGLEYNIISEKINLPVEYYLQMVHFEKVYSFFCSTAFYNGYLFPKMEFISILKDYYEVSSDMNPQRAEVIQNMINSEAYKRFFNGAK